MKIARSLNSASQLCAAASGPVVLVPTMGALHEGHATLLRRGRRIAGPRGFLVVSIFVNPAQFRPGEDFSRYPRPFAADRRLCEKAGADLLFHPTGPAMYPEGFSTYVEEQALSRGLCGRSRPGHFRGVCTVVLKLFEITRPAVALFGLKDLQQYMVLRRMVRDLNLRIRLVGVETVRDPDGLAVSSRNQYLSRAERAQAPVLRKSLLFAQSAFKRGERRAARLRQLIVSALRKESLARIDYVEIVSPDSLTPVAEVRKGAIIAVAVFFGTTRLIDNLLLRE